MNIKSNDQIYEVIELIYKIQDDGSVVNLKENETQQAFDGVEGINQDDYQAYLALKEKLKSFNLKKKIDKVNSNDGIKNISIYANSDELLSSAILHAIIFCLKPLQGEIDLKKISFDTSESSDGNKISFMKSYLTTNLEKIKNEVISRYIKGKRNKLSFKIEYESEGIIKNFGIFNDLLVDNILIWVSSQPNQAQLKSEQEGFLEELIRKSIDDFFSKNLDLILERINY
jgi:hypothetical protein